MAIDYQTTRLAYQIISFRLVGPLCLWCMHGISLLLIHQYLVRSIQGSHALKEGGSGLSVGQESLPDGRHKQQEQGKGDKLNSEPNF